MLSAERKNAIDDFLYLQDNFKKLCDKKILKHFVVNRSQEEWVDDKWKELKKGKDKPFIREYPEFLVFHGAMILNALDNSILCIDDIETEKLKEFSELIRAKINLYSVYLDVVLPQSHIDKMNFQVPEDWML